MTTRVLPHNLHAERCLIGSLLMEPARLADIAGLVSPTDCYDPRHMDILQAAIDLDRNGDWDSVAVATELIRRRLFDDIGGDYFRELLDAVPYSYQIAMHAKTVREYSQRRQLIGKLTDSMALAWNESADLDDVMAGVSACVRQWEEATAASDPVTLRSAVGAELMQVADRQRNPQPAGFQTGLVDLDELAAAGLRRGKTCVVAARPSMGKTALSLQVAVAFAERHGIVLFCSMEQGAGDIARRAIASHTGIDSARLLTGDVSPLECDRLVELEADTTERLILDARPARSLRQVAASVRLAQRSGKVAAVFIDYLQLMEPEDKKQPREQQVAALSKGLHALAEMEDVLIVILAQLNRGVDGRPDKRPKLSDLRESGAIEQDADLVVFIDRPEMRDATDRPGEADIIVAKNREGPTGIVKLTYRKELTRFESAAAFVPVMTQHDTERDKEFWGDGRTYGM